MGKEIIETFEPVIDFIVLKLHSKKSKEEIAKWLNNFSEEDQVFALDILQRLTYVSEEQLFVAADRIVRQIDSEVPVNFKIFFYPIAKYGKSATLMSYYFQKSSAFKILEKTERVKFISNENQIRSLIIDNTSVLVFFDDFFGSGGSFSKFYRYVSSISRPEFLTAKNVYATALYYMNDAADTLKKTLNHIKIIGDIHPKIFGEDPLMFSSESQRVAYKRLAYSYSDTKKLFLTRDRQHFLGYMESEALISFPYVPPNNTLPIMWSGKSKWYPLFPRMEDDILENLLRYKEQLLVAATKLDFGLPNSFGEIKGVTKTRFIVFGILRMLHQRIVIPQIAALMGVGVVEIEKFIKLAIEMGFVEDNLTLSERGNEALKNIISIVKEYKKQMNEQHPDVVIKEIPYVAKRISGK